MDFPLKTHSGARKTDTADFLNYNFTFTISAPAGVSIYDIFNSCCPSVENFVFHGEYPPQGTMTAYNTLFILYYSSPFLITVTPPMYGTRTSGTVTLPSSFW